MTAENRYRRARMLLTYLSATVLGAGIAVATRAADYTPFSGKVVQVVDGDTCDIRVPVGGNRYEDTRVRLFAVDAPEVHHKDGKRIEWQPYGLEAAKVLEKLLLDESVTVRPVSLSYGRVVGIVTRESDGLDISSELVKRGSAEVEPRYNRSQALRDYQAAAKKAKVGIWGIDRHISAWDWRKGKR